MTDVPIEFNPEYAMTKYLMIRQTERMKEYIETTMKILVNKHPDYFNPHLERDKMILDISKDLIQIIERGIVLP